MFKWAKHLCKWMININTLDKVVSLGVCKTFRQEYLVYITSYFVIWHCLYCWCPFLENRQLISAVSRMVQRIFHLLSVLTILFCSCISLQLVQLQRGFKKWFWFKILQIQIQIIQIQGKLEYSEVYLDEK